MEDVFNLVILGIKCRENTVGLADTGIGWACTSCVNGMHLDSELMVKAGCLQCRCGGYQRQKD